MKNSKNKNFKQNAADMVGRRYNKLALVLVGAIASGLIAMTCFFGHIRGNGGPSLSAGGKTTMRGPVVPRLSDHVAFISCDRK